MLLGADNLTEMMKEPISPIPQTLPFNKEKAALGKKTFF
jgi:hypothetical protein